MFFSSPKPLAKKVETSALLQSSSFCSGHQHIELQGARVHCQRQQLSPHLSFEGLDGYFNSAICSGIIARGARQSYAPRVGPFFELAGKLPSPVAMDATDVEIIHAKPEEHVHCGSCHPLAVLVIIGEARRKILVSKPPG